MKNHFYCCGMPKLLLLLTAFLFLIAGCKSDIEIIEEKDDDGNVIISYERRISDFAKHGFHKEFHSSGKLFAEAVYVDNRIEGERNLFYESGQKQAEEKYVLGKLEGIFNSYFESGVLQSEGNYTNHAMKGEWKFYYPSGKLKEIVTFDDNEEQGPFKEYYENGNMKAEGFYQDGDNEAGPLKLYDETGELKERLDCKIVFFADVMASQCKSVWKAGEENEEAKEETKEE